MNVHHRCRQASQRMLKWEYPSPRAANSSGIAGRRPNSVMLT
jgi:hypothetical protein